MNCRLINNGFDPLSYCIKGFDRVSPKDVAIIQSTFRGFISDSIAWLQIEFEVWDWENAQLLGLFLGMAFKLGMVNGDESLEALLRLAVDIIDSYLNNPYHNSSHAFDVAFMVYYMLEDLGVILQLSVTKAECIALFIGALGHDMGHPGLNNMYQINSHSTLADRYSNKSVLENYSIDLLYGLLDDNPYLNLIFPGDKEAIIQIKDLIKILILNTDMAYHFENVAKLLVIVEKVCNTPESFQKLSEIDEEASAPIEKYGLIPDATPESVRNSTRSGYSGASVLSYVSLAASSNDDSLPRVNTDDLESRNILLSAILHAADISNPARPFLISKLWSDKVMEEFFLQGDKEKTIGLPVSPSMDREITNERDVTNGFTNFIVQPFFDLLSMIFPRIDCFSVLLKNNAQRRESNDEESPLQAMSLELMNSSQSEMSANQLGHIKSKFKDSTPGMRKVSLAAGMIEIQDDLISMSGKIMYNKQHRKTIVDDFSRRGTMKMRSSMRENKI